MLDACELAADGMPPQQIYEEMNRRKLHLDVSFVLDTLDYLRYGGRCSSLAAFGANMLRLKPSIQVTDGVMGVSRKYRGLLKNALLIMSTTSLPNPIR